MYEKKSYKDIVEELSIWLTKWAIELDYREAYDYNKMFDPATINIERLAVKSVIAKLDELKLNAIKTEYNYPQRE